MKVTNDYKNHTCTYRELLKDDNKNGLFYSIRDLGMKASTKFKKDELVDMLDSLFTDNPFYIIDRCLRMSRIFCPSL